MRASHVQLSQSAVPRVPTGGHGDHQVRRVRELGEHDDALLVGVPIPGKKVKVKGKR